MFFRGKTTVAAVYRIARTLAGDLLKRRSPRLTGRNLLGQWRARRGDYSLDPHRLGLEHIMDLNERAGRAVAFYFIPRRTPTPSATTASASTTRTCASAR